MEELALGVVIGIGLSALKRAYRPVAKRVIKIGLTTAEAAKEAFHEGGESLQDLLAEAKHEIAEAQRAREAAADEAPAPGAPDPSTTN